MALSVGCGGSGSATTNRSCYASLARTIDHLVNDLGDDKISVATLFPSTTAADTVCQGFANDTSDAYLIHAGEGVNASALLEFGKVPSRR